MRRLLIPVACLLCSGTALAQVSVYSPRPDAVSVTVYREGIALITETRSVELPAEPVTVVFQGVVESLLPRSAVMEGAGRPLAETDFHYDRLTPASLLRNSVGQVISIVRTSPRTGTVTRLDAMVVSADNGVVLRSVEGNEALYCSGLPERLEFSHVPEDLVARPTLSVRLAGGNAGTRTVTVSYLATGFGWSADYVAHLNRSSSRMDLTGWITLRNETGSAFQQAQVQLVAGSLNLLSPDAGGSRPPPSPVLDQGALDPATGMPTSSGDLVRTQDERTIGEQITLLHNCYPLATTTDGLPKPPVYSADVVDLNIIPSYLLDRMDVVTGGASATYGSGAMAGIVNLVFRQELADYQLYRLPWPTDLNARQTKQVAFLDRKKIKVERFYGIRVSWGTSGCSDPQDAPSVTLRWLNKRSAGLGEPLPAGMVRVFEPRGDGAVFAGEAQIRDLPVGLPAEIGIARALDVVSESTVEDEYESGDDGRIVTIQASHHFINQKDVPLRFELRCTDLNDHYYSTPDVVRSSRRVRYDRGTLLWRFTVPAGGERSLRYELRAEEADAH